MKSGSHAAELPPLVTWGTSPEQVVVDLAAACRWPSEIARRE